MTVPYFAMDHQKAEKILYKVFPAGWNFVPFDPLQPAVTLLLFSPLYCYEHFISADQVWKNYLAVHQPQVKLISVGVYPVQQLNYLDLLQPPENFTNFFDTARKCHEDWLPVNTQGLDLFQKLRRFFDGHGAESLRDAFNILLRRFRIARDEINNGIPYEETLQDFLLPLGTIAVWQKLINRWQAYHPFFEVLPFRCLFDQIDEQLNLAHPFFEQGCQNYQQLHGLQIIEKLEFINELLKEAEQYVQEEPPHTDH